MSNSVQTIQLTSKKWKLLKMISVLLMGAGVFTCSTASGKPAQIDTAVYFWLGGFAVYLYAAFGAWWNHG